MDLLDFEGEQMYFDEPVGSEVDTLLDYAAAHYGEPDAEHALLRAYFLEPEHLTVLVALYRYFYYRHRYADALLIADRAMIVTATQLGIAIHWQQLTADDFAQAVLTSMSLTRFLLLALKGSGYLQLRLDNPEGALERLEKILEIDTDDRLGVTSLVTLARGKVTEKEVASAGENVAFLAT